MDGPCDECRMVATDVGQKYSAVRAACAFTVTAAVLILAPGAATAPTFQLVFDGRHNAALLHEGTFTTSSSWCPSGTALDVGVDATTDTATRRFTCATGGDFTATVRPLPAEHGGNGVWQIVAGTGPLSNLRGKGVFTSARLTGSSDDPSTITFHSSWSGIADFDTTAPAVTLTGATARRLKRPKLTCSFRAVLTLSDTDGPMSYIVDVVDPRKPFSSLVYKLGSISSGTLTVNRRVKVRRGTRFLRIKIDVSDAVGNQSAFAKTIRLR
jgi:hypothetical protein